MTHKTISKGLRFDVFRRDKFTCQYCGKTPPQVALEIDHIIPLSEGGSDDFSNLITSCFECNRGKGKKILANKVAREDLGLDYLEIQQRVAELERYKEAKKKFTKLTNEQVEELVNFFRNTIGTDWEPERSSVRWLLLHHDPDEIERAIVMASVQAKLYGTNWPSEKWKYAYAILRNWRGEKGNA